MEKQIREFLGIQEKLKKPQSMVFYLDDVLEKDPQKYCPNCDSSKVEILHTHNPDGLDYRCKKCSVNYEIVLCNRNENQWGA